jgi:hypothetical protein
VSKAIQLLLSKMTFWIRIWMLDLSREVPSSTTIHGFDIDLGQCPHPASFPPNVNITKWDMFTPPPAELIGTFDVVHMRLVTLVIKNNDPTALITNVAQLLSMSPFELPMRKLTCCHV